MYAIPKKCAVVVNKFSDELQAKCTMYNNCLLVSHRVYLGKHDLDITAEVRCSERTRKLLFLNNGNWLRDRKLKKKY